MDFLKNTRRRSLLSEVIYNGLNVALAVALLVIVITIDSPVPALLVVLLSKWRVLAVRPRYWVANIQANLVDLIVSVSTVIFLYSSQHSLIIQVILTALYAAWLLFLKPKSKRHFVILQAGMATFVGVAALYSVAYAWPVSLVVLGVWVIGYASARHVFNAYEEHNLSLLSLAWGFIVAEIGWVMYHWVAATPIGGIQNLAIPEVAIVVLGVSFVAQQAYASYKKHKEMRIGDIILPIFLVAGVVLFLLIRELVRNVRIL